jgi:hypothetical protein
MSNKIGRFEILSELAKSDSGSVYKASDPESGQLLALKVMRLDVFGEHAEEVTERILQEAESTKDLSSPNITLVYGAGEIDGQFCAAMEYVQGNSVATMLARKEGFSIWDLLDISRQVCQGLDHAHQHNVFHYSLEPAKVMVTWDGTVKILSFGISSGGYAAAQAAGFPPTVLYYMSPEQVRGEPLDARSNLFTWGAMLYEMVTDQKAFPGEDADLVRQKIIEGIPIPPAQLNPKINRLASEVIMKALAKDPAQRYASGHDLIADLEKCREAAGKGSKKNEPAKAPAAANPARSAAAMGKFAAKVPSVPAAPAPPPAPEPEVSAGGVPLQEELETSWSAPIATVRRGAEAAEGSQRPAPAKMAAAASTSGGSRSRVLDPSAQFLGASARGPVEGMGPGSPTLSGPALEESVADTPQIAVDPLMAEDGGSGANGPSFSDLAELPPLKDVYIAPPPPKAEAPVTEEPPSLVFRPREPEKPKVDPREVAEKAIKEIKGVPPKLMVYSISAAVAVVLVIAGYLTWQNHSQSTDEVGTVPRHAAVAQAPEQAQPAAPAPDASAPAPEPAQPEAQAPAQGPEPTEPPTSSARAGTARARRERRNRKTTAVATAAVVTGELTIDSVPEGAQVQIDGRADASWITPHRLLGLAPGVHSIVISKAGFGQESRTVQITAGSNAALSVHLTALNAIMSVTSNPAGAAIYVDGKDTGRMTPAQITIDKGTHTILVRKSGYLDETTSAAGQPGQTFHFAPTLRPLGNADDIKTVGKFKKLFGGGGAQAGMGKVTIRTTPKGAQIAVNRRMLDKTSPVEFLVTPGNYVIDITATGYKPLEKVVTVDKEGSIVIDETLQPQ